MPPAYSAALFRRLKLMEQYTTSTNAVSDVVSMMTEITESMIDVVAPMPSAMPMAEMAFKSPQKIAMIR